MHFGYGAGYYMLKPFETEHDSRKGKSVQNQLQQDECLITKKIIGASRRGQKDIFLWSRNIESDVTSHNPRRRSAGTH